MEPTVLCINNFKLTSLPPLETGYLDVRHMRNTEKGQLNSSGLKMQTLTQRMCQRSLEAFYVQTFCFILFCFLGLVTFLIQLPRF